MSTRIAELESHLRAWERRSRRRTMLLVLIPILVAAALAYAGHARVARVEQALSEGLAGLSAEPELSPSLEQNLDRLPGLVAELKSLRPLPEQLIAARDARNRAEADLARLRDETSTLVGDRDGLATALGIAKGELARAQAERADIEQRQDELLRQVETSRAALAQREQALEAERNARTQAEEQLAAEREARSAAEQARAALSGERERAGQALEAERTARAEAERQLAAEREAKAAAEQARTEIEARLRQLTARQATAAQQAARAAEELRSAGTDRARLAQELALAQTRASAAERAQADLQQQIRDLRAALAQAQAQRSGSWQENPPALPSPSSGMMPAPPRL